MVDPEPSPEGPLKVSWGQRSYSLNWSKRVYIGNYIRDCYEAIKGDTRSLDHSLYRYMIVIWTDLGFTVGLWTCLDQCG